MPRKGAKRIASSRDRDSPEHVLANIPEGTIQKLAELAALARDNKDSLGVRLLDDIRTIFGSEDAMSTKKLLERLHGLEEAPWADLRGKPLNDRRLAQLLGRYGVKSKEVRIGDWHGKGYTREDLYDCWQRYLSPLPQNSATSATSATGQDSSRDNAAINPRHAATDRDNPGAGNCRCAQCGAADGEVRRYGNGVWLHQACRSFWLQARA